MAHHPTHSDHPASDASIDLGAVLNAVPMAALIASPKGDVLHSNAAMNALCGWSPMDNGTRTLAALMSEVQATQLLHQEGEQRIVAIDPRNPAISRVWHARTCGASTGERLLTTLPDGIAAEHEAYIVEHQWFETAAALSGGLAHDFNNILAAILGLSEIVALRLPDGSPLHPFTTKIATSVDRAKHLVRRFSQFSRKRTGIVEPSPTGMILEELAPLLSAFLPGNIPLSKSICADTPWCDVDRHAFEQSIINCVNFLRTTMRTEGGTLSLSCRGSTDRKQVVVEISGQGRGLKSVSDVDALFQLSLQPTQTAYESGAGLFVAHRLATLSNGSLTASIKEPGSLAFTLIVPGAA